METRAGTIFVELELLLDEYRRGLEEARRVGEDALNGLDATPIIRAMFDVQSLQMSLQSVEGIVAAASEIYSDQASVLVRARVDQLTLDLATAEAIIMEAVARIRSGSDVSIGLDLTNLTNQSDQLNNEASDIADSASDDAVIRPTIDAEGIGQGLEQAVNDAADNVSDAVSVTPTVDVSSVEQGLLERIRELTEQADRAAVVTPSLALEVLQSNLDRANELVAEALESGDREAIVTARIALDLIREDFGTIEDEASMIALPEIRAEVRADIQNVRDGVDQASALLDTVQVDEPLQLLLDVATLEAELADIQLSIVEAFRNGDEAAVITAQLELSRFNASIDEVRETLENEIPTEQDVEIRARFGNLVGRAVQAQTVIARGFMESTQQAQAAIDRLNVDGGRSLDSLGTRLRGAFELRRDNPLVRANVALIATNQAVQTAVNGAAIAASVLSGNFEDAADQVKALPGPIGAMANTLDTALRFATGLTSELARMEESLQRNAANAEARLRLQTLGDDGVSTIRDQIRAFRELIEVQNASTDERPQIRLNQLMEERVRRAGEEIDMAKEAISLTQEQSQELARQEDLISNNNVLLAEQNLELERARAIEAGTLSESLAGGTRQFRIDNATAEISRLEQESRDAQATIDSFNDGLRTQRDRLERGRPAVIAAAEAANAAQQASLDRAMALEAETQAIEDQASAEERRLGSIQSLRDAQAELQALTLRSQGREAEADNLEIARAAERRVEALRAQLDELRSSGVNSIENIDAQNVIRQEIEIVQTISRGEQAENIEDENNEIRDSTIALEREIEDIRLRGQQRLLQAQGRGLEAQLLGINAAYDRRIQEANASGQAAQTALIEEARSAAISQAELEARLSADAGSVVDISGARLGGTTLPMLEVDTASADPIPIEMPDVVVPMVEVADIPPIEVPEPFDMANAAAPANEQINMIGANDDRRDNAIRRVEQAVARVAPSDGVARFG